MARCYFLPDLFGLHTLAPNDVGGVNLDGWPSGLRHRS